MTFALTDKELISAATDAGFVYEGHGGLFNSYIEGVDIGSHVLSFARAVIAADRARWGRPAIRPVPVSERWPEFSDCDQQERVWAWNPLLDHWKLTRLKRSIHTHWRPYWALPVPTTQEAPR
jgi:hypothetical protein